MNMHDEAADIQSYGVDVDELMIKLAYVGLIYSSSRRSCFIRMLLSRYSLIRLTQSFAIYLLGIIQMTKEPADYELKSSQGHSYAHHLLIEQSIKHTAPGGYLFFLIPNGLFETAETANLHRYLKEAVHIQGILQLPLSMFKNQDAAKSILILQKKDDGILAPKEVLLATLPQLSNMAALDKMMQQIEEWFTENK